MNKKYFWYLRNRNMEQDIVLVIINSSCLNINDFVFVEDREVVRDNLLLAKKTRTLFGLIFVFRSHSLLVFVLYFKLYLCTIVFLFVKDRKVVADNLSLAKKTRTVSRAKSAIATTNS